MKAMMLGAALAVAAGAGHAAAQAPIGAYPNGALLVIGNYIDGEPRIQCGLASGGGKEVGGTGDPADALGMVSSSSLALASSYRGDTARSATLVFSSFGLAYDFDTDSDQRRRYAVSYYGPARMIFADAYKGRLEFLTGPLISTRQGEPPASAKVTFNNFKSEASGDGLTFSFGLRITTPETECLIRVRGAFAK